MTQTIDYIMANSKTKTRCGPMIRPEKHVQDHAARLLEEYGEIAGARMLGISRSPFVKIAGGLLVTEGIYRVACSRM